MSSFRIYDTSTNQISPVQMPSPSSLHHDIEATLSIGALSGQTSSLTIPIGTLLVQTDGSRDRVTALLGVEETIPNGAAFQLEIYNIQGGGFEIGVPFTMPGVYWQTAGGPHEFLTTIGSQTVNPTSLQALISLCRRYNLLRLST